MPKHEFRQPHEPLTRPKDAATLILYRRAGGDIEVLMGERHGRHRFMPNRYVFPGGRVDAGDGRCRAASELRHGVAERLARGCPGDRARAMFRARALAMAAIRETFEEAGLVIGRPDPHPGAPATKAWRAFYATGMAPALDTLDYLARAVTPPHRHVRFNARFFVADASHAVGDIKGSGELEGVRWLALAEARKLPIPNITGVVLEQLDEMLRHPPAPDPMRPVPLYHMRHGQHRRDQE